MCHGFHSKLLVSTGGYTGEPFHGETNGDFCHSYTSEWQTLLKVASYPTKPKNTSDCAVIWRKLWWFDCFHLQSLFSFECKLLCICSSAYTSLEITIIAMGSKKEVFPRSSKLAMEHLFLELWFTSIGLASIFSHRMLGVRSIEFHQP